MDNLQSTVTDGEIKNAALKLLAYCRANNWAGYDPYDALNSGIFKALPFLNFRVPRLVLTQALKRSPINIRPLALVPKTQNPKAIGLFLSAFVNLSKGGIADREGLVEAMVGRLVALRSKNVPYWCWGYSFPWQMRQKIVPSGAPNLVCTTFAASALLDAYEHNHDPRCLDMAASAAEYILNDLYWAESETFAGFSYPLRSIRVLVYNANFLASALLCRVYKLTGDDKFLGPALRAARCSAAKQNADGSWYYGDAPTQGWIDNFHTGFNLGALKSIGKYAETTEFEPCIQRGFEFYRNHFYREDGAARYFHNSTFPIDIHAVAQSIITPLEMDGRDAANRQMSRAAFRYAMNHMWDDRGFFYYRVLRSCTIRTSYMRWSQAWMLLALSSLLRESDETMKNQQIQVSSALAGAR
jgi:hypothetical protein